MTPSQYGSAFLRWWWLIVAGTVIGVLVGVTVLGAPAPRHAAYANVLLSASPTSASTPTDAYNSTLVAQQRVQSYASITDNPTLVSELATETTMTVDEVTTALTIVVPTNTTIVAVRFIDDDPDVAVAAAQSTAERVVEVVRAAERRPDQPPLLRARVVSPAESATELTAPVPWRNPVIASVTGLLLGLAAAVVAARRDSRLRLASSVAEDVDAPVAGIMPRRGGKHDNTLAVVRQVRADLLLRRARSPHGIRVVVTAPDVTPGVSRTAMALATSLADADATVLLVEADLYRPVLAERVGADQASPGLASFLEGGTPRGDLVRRSAADELDVVVSGRVSGDPSDLLQSPALAGVLADASSRYDVTVVTAPAAARGTEAAAVAAHCDAAVLVVTRGRTRRRDLRSAVAELRRADADIIATVLLT